MGLFVVIKFKKKNNNKTPQCQGRSLSKIDRQTLLRFRPRPMRAIMLFHAMHSKIDNNSNNKALLEPEFISKKKSCHYVKNFSYNYCECIFQLYFV